MKNYDPSMERLTAYLDQELNAQERKELEQEVAGDDRLRRGLALEHGVRSLLRDRKESLRERVPVDVERSIRLALAREVSAATQPQPASFWVTLVAAFRRPMVAIPTAVAAVALVTMLLTDRSTPPPFAVMSPRVDLYEASYANFSRIVKGDITLVKATSDAAELQQFFRKEGVQYEVFFPEISAELKGGVVSDHGGLKFAHLVYGVGDHLVYIFEVDEASIEQNLVSMRETVTQDLAQSRWHWEERQGFGTMFVWESNNIVCSAVSDLRTQDLSALFTLEKL